MARAKKMRPVTRGARSQSPVRAIGELAGREAAAEESRAWPQSGAAEITASGASSRDTADGATSAVSVTKESPLKVWSVTVIMVRLPARRGNPRLRHGR